MSLLVIIFGVLTLLLGAVIIINPEIVFGYAKNRIEKPGLQVMAVTARLVPGTLLIYLTGVSRFPLAIFVIGWLLLIAAIFLALIGRDNFQRLASRALSWPRPYARAAGGIAACFGSFLVYAFV